MGIKVKTWPMRVSFHDDGEWYQAFQRKGSTACRVVLEADWQKLMSVLRAAEGLRAHLDKRTAVSANEQR